MPKFNTAFTCLGRGEHCTTGVALERDINQHMDAEGEIAREHRSRLAPDLFPSNLSLSVHMLVYVPFPGYHHSAVAPPTHARESRVLNFGIQVPF